MSPNNSHWCIVSPFFTAVAKWTRPTGLSADCNGEVRLRPGERAFRHRPRDRFRHCAGAGDQSHVDAEQFGLRHIRVGHEPTVDHVRRSGDFGQGGGDQPTGAAFRDGDHPASALGAVQDGAGGGFDVVRKHGSLGPA
jgi:hypothetical protein